MDGGKAHMTALRAWFEPGIETLDSAIDEATAWLAGQQAADGHWVFELEADATIPSEYILLNHFTGEIDKTIESKLAVYLRRTQGSHGGWPLYFDGAPDVSCSVKAYYALKLIGDDPNAPHMRRAREVILDMGGAARANVFCRYGLALFRQVPWRAVPFIRPEAVLLPKWAPFHLDKVSYWSRTTMVPLFVVAALKPKAKNPRGIGIRELFTTPPEKEKRYLVNPTGHWLGNVFLAADQLGRRAEPLIAPLLQRQAIERAMAFIHERLNGEDGLGAIFPAMANSVMAMDALGYGRDHPDRAMCRRAIDKLLVHRSETEASLQPCVSPVWDTALAMHASLEADGDGAGNRVADGAAWLRERQVLDVVGDWAANRPNLRPGGWAFQYRNAHYPDVDDTAAVVMALHRSDPESNAELDRAGDRVGARHAEPQRRLGRIRCGERPLRAEQHSLRRPRRALDPPTADVTARCLGMLAQLGYGREHPAVARGLDYLRREQEADGSWFGRWGTNYIYGTWSVLAALNAVGEDMARPLHPQGGRLAEGRGSATTAAGARTAPATGASAAMPRRR